MTGSGPQGQPSLRGPYLGEAEADYRHSGASTAAVYFYANGERVVVRLDGGQTERPRRIRKPTAIGLVALGRHHTRVAQQLPAAGGGRFFRAEIDVVWEVTDPVRVAERQLHDVTILLPELFHRLRGITGRFRISDAAGAMAEVNRFLDDARIAIAADYGMDARVFVQLNLDDAEIKGIGQLDEDAWQAQLEEQRRRRLMTTLAGGDLARAAALTAQDPAQLATAIKMLTDSEKADRTQMIEFFRYLLDIGAISRAQLGAKADTIVGWVRGGGDPSMPYSIDWARPEDDPPARDHTATPPPSRRAPSQPEWLDDDAEARPEEFAEHRYRESRPAGIGEPARGVEVIDAETDWPGSPRRRPGGRSTARDDDWADNDRTANERGGNDSGRPRQRTHSDDEGDW